MPMILTEEQTLLQDTAKQFVTDKAPISQLRQLRDDDSAAGFNEPTWKEMVELGLPGTPFSTDYGGSGFGYKGLGVITEETGRTLTASPLFASVWLSGTILNIGGSEAQKTELLGGITSGDLLVALALEETTRHNPYGASTSCAISGDSVSLSGKKQFVLDGHVADKLIVVARSSGEAGDRDGLTLVLVDSDASGVSITRTKMVDSRNAAIVELNDVEVSAGSVVGQVGQGADVLDPALDIARIGLCAEMLGSTQECFDRTIAYLKERQQFGVPIGSFQALKHRAANMFCEIELSKSAVLEALTAIDEGRDAKDIAILASLAKVKVGDTYHTVSREGIQMHGGIGMTDEFDIGFFIKRAAVAEQTLGDSSFHRDRYGVLNGY